MSNYLTVMDRNSRLSLNLSWGTIRIQYPNRTTKVITTIEEALPEFEDKRIVELFFEKLGAN